MPYLFEDFLRQLSWRENLHMRAFFYMVVYSCRNRFSRHLWSIPSHLPAWRQLEEFDTDHHSLLKLTKIEKLWKTRFIWWTCFSGQLRYFRIENFGADAANLINRDGVANALRVMLICCVSRKRKDVCFLWNMSSIACGNRPLVFQKIYSPQLLATHR